MSKFINDDLIEDIRLSNNIVDVVSDYIKIEKKGKDYFGLCPFHKEKTPSFSVAPNKQIFYCFGCGKGGNVIHFIKEIENIDFIEAIKLLAERVNIILPEGDDEKEIQIEKDKRRLLEINKIAAKIFYNNLNSVKGKKAMEYLQNRDISNDIIRNFGLGYSLIDYDSLIKEMISKKYSEKDLLSLGLILENKNGGYYERFRDRIIFPIFDLRNNVIGFGGRIIEKEGNPKYMNSPQSVLYNKGNNLYGLNIAKNHLDGIIIVVEGYMDVISLYKAGFKNVVATLGTAMTLNQARIIKKYADEVIIAYDMDQAGRKAALRGIGILEQVGCKIKVLEITNSKDPDEFISKFGPKAFSEILEKAKTFVEYKINLLQEKYDNNSTEDRIKFIKNAALVLTALESRVEREIYAKKIAKEYGISEEAVFSEINKNLSKNNKDDSKKIQRNEKKVTSISEYNNILKVELYILVMLGLNYTLYENIKNKISREDFSNELILLTEKVFTIIMEKKEYTPAEFISNLPNDLVGEISKSLKMMDQGVNSKKSFLEAVQERDILYAERGKIDILNRLRETSLSTSDKELLRETYINFERTIKERKK